MLKVLMKLMYGAAEYGEERGRDFHRLFAAKRFTEGNPAMKSVADLNSSKLVTPQILHLKYLCFWGPL